MYLPETKPSTWSTKRRIAFAIAIFFVSTVISGVPYLEFISVIGLIGAGFLFVWKGKRRKIQHAIIVSAGLLVSIAATLLILIFLTLALVSLFVEMSVESSFYSPAIGGARVSVNPVVAVIGMIVGIASMGAIGGFLASIFRGEEFGQ